MIFYRCKCGKSTAHSSMGVSACDTCDKCGSTLATGPNSHQEPKPHDIRAEIRDGKVKCFCAVCLRDVGTLADAKNAEEIRQQIKALGELMAT